MTDSPLTPEQQGVMDFLHDRGMSPLPDDALVQYERIAKAPTIGDNVRVVVRDDGAVHVGRNDGDVPPPDGSRYDTTIPDAPAHRLDDAATRRLRDLLTGVDPDAPPTTPPGRIRGGVVRVVTIRTPDGEVRELVHDNTATELTEVLDGLVDEPTSDDAVDWDAIRAGLRSLPGNEYR